MCTGFIAFGMRKSHLPPEHCWPFVRLVTAAWTSHGDDLAGRAGVGVYCCARRRLRATTVPPPLQQQPSLSLSPSLWWMWTVGRSWWRSSGSLSSCVVGVDVVCSAFHKL